MWTFSQKWVTNICCPFHLGFPLFQCGRWTKTHQNEDHVFSNENTAVWLGPELGTKIKTTAEKLFGGFSSYELYKSLTSHIY